FVRMLSCFAPHLGEKLHQMLTGEDTLAYAEWPSFDEAALKLDTVEIVVQINGKVRARMDVPGNLTREALTDLVMEDGQVKELLAGKEPVKVIAVPGKLINIVVR
ncbi:MAG: class I tRNA ligase family protein, partial [Firmicutes bacterium]|nr:class I tRNA ligase family protein [Bacillota bacterium]